MLCVTPAAAHGAGGAAAETGATIALSLNGVDFASSRVSFSFSTSSSSATSLHRYVRAPNVGRTALIHMSEASSTNYASVRVSWVDEASVPVDE